MQRDPNVLSNSKDPRELVRMARAYAASKDPREQAVLAAHLGSGDFLNRLNTGDEYFRSPPRRLEVAGIIQALMKQNTPEAIRTLVSLTDKQAYNAYDPLIELLIHAVAADIPVSPPTLAYWKRYIPAESVYSDMVIEAIFINRCEASLQLFEQAMKDPSYEDEYKDMWLRDPMLRKRNDTNVLKCCERMLIGNSVDMKWQECILESLFDYSESWYLSCKIPRPPLRVLAPDQSKEILKRIGKHVLTGRELYTPGLRTKIENAMKELGYDWKAKDDPGTRA
jgi:hypothetical protein